MNSKIPKTWIIVLQHKRSDLTMKCIDSLQQHLPYPVAILIVDNGSAQQEIDAIKALSTDVDYLLLQRNYGYGGGNNRGASMAIKQGAERLIFLNNDTEVLPGWYEHLMEALDCEDVGIAGSAIINRATGRVEFDGNVFSRNLCCGGYSDIAVEELPDEITDIAYACGAAMAIKASLFERLGGFEESFFAYNEDIDLSLRCWIAGQRVVLAPRSKMLHFRGQSALELFKKEAGIERMGMRNALLTSLRCYELKTLKDALPSAIRTYLSRHNLRRALLGAIPKIPYAIIARKRIQKARVMSDKEIFSRVNYR